MKLNWDENQRRLFSSAAQALEEDVPRRDLPLYTHVCFDLGLSLQLNENLSNEKMQIVQYILEQNITRRQRKFLNTEPLEALLADLHWSPPWVT